MMVEKTCRDCNGTGGHDSWTGLRVACLNCKGAGRVMEPDDEECVRMMDAVLREREARG
jgi:DnaJ-class molecular chaperone